MAKIENTWMKWRWEFMRRNSAYKKDYEKVRKLHSKAKYRPLSIVEKEKTIDGKTYIDDYDLYCDTPEYQEEKKIAMKWGLNTILDPNQSFEEITGRQFCKDETDWLHSLCFFDNEFQDIHSKAVKVLNSQDRGENKPWFVTRLGNIRNIDSYLDLHIDFDKINSLSKLKKEISELVNEHYKAYQKLQGKSQLYTGIDYDLILKIGDMKDRESLTYNEIIEKVFPDDVDPESARIKVIQHYNRYRELVDTGYINLTFP
jgi:hypothetical protein